MTTYDILNATITNGGCTYNVYTDTNLANSPSYAVSMYPECEKIISLSSIVYTNLDSINLYLYLNKELLRIPTNSLGTWLDDGKVYLDIVRTIPDKGEALRIAKDNNELAIFDLLNMEEIRL